MNDEIVILSKMNPTGTISCPYCNKGKSYSFGCTGKQSQPCDKCYNMVLCEMNGGRGIVTKNNAGWRCDGEENA